SRRSIDLSCRLAGCSGAAAASLTPVKHPVRSAAVRAPLAADLESNLGRVRRAPLSVKALPRRTHAQGPNSMMLDLLACPPAMDSGQPEGARRSAPRDRTPVRARAGRVSLVGAGPGDPELLTLRAARRIAEADAIVYDHLV